MITRRAFTGIAAATAAIALRAADLATDRHRPQYHFLPPSNWMNDPNGPIYHKGSYHMFYQYAPEQPWSRRHWGHAISKDMLHWKHLPIALPIEPDGLDKKGVWSGSVVIDDHGVPTAIYTGGGGQNLATSDDDMIVWKRYAGNPVLSKPPAGMQLTGWRDPAVWKEADGWHMLIGGGFKDVAGTALLYRSADLRKWEYLHPIYTGKLEQRLVADLKQGEDMWECPDFFPVGGKHVLIASLIAFPQQSWYTRVPYYMGTYKDHKLEVQRVGETDFGWVYASKTQLDAAGRRIYWGLIRERRSGQACQEAGWSGVLSLPRVLSLRPDGLLGMDPLPELQTLRGEHTRIGPTEVSGDPPLLKDVRGDCLEIIAELESGSAEQFGIRVRSSVNGEEQTRIGYDRARKLLTADMTKSSLDKSATGRKVQAGNFELGPKERLRLHVFLDASVIEVFANGRACLTERTYPGRTDSLGLGLYSAGGRARLVSMDVWQIKPISSDRLTT